eukprot:7391022-Karenia_brevis.AAC.1
MRLSILPHKRPHEYSPGVDARVLAAKGWRAIAILPLVSTMLAWVRNLVARVRQAIALLHA